MLPDRVSNPGPLTYESGALPIALRGPAKDKRVKGTCIMTVHVSDAFMPLCYSFFCNRINSDYGFTNRHDFAVSSINISL